jgi:hypothetical protein
MGCEFLREGSFGLLSFGGLVIGIYERSNFLSDNNKSKMSTNDDTTLQGIFFTYTKLYEYIMIKVRAWFFGVMGLLVNVFFCRYVQRICTIAS